MLTKEILKQNTVLSKLEDTILDAVVSISNNDTKGDVDKAIGDLHRKYDDDIKSITGIERQGGVKTYAYLKDVLTDLKTKATKVDSLTGEINTLKTTNADLQKQIENGSTDESLKGELAKAKQNLLDKQNELDTVKSDYESKETDFKNQISTLKKETTMSVVAGGIADHMTENKLKYSTTIPESILKETIANRRKSLFDGLTIDRDYTDDQGKKVTVFRDAEGNILRNKADGQKPYTAGALFYERNKDLFEQKKELTGGGTGSPGGGGTPTSLDLSGAKTQVQADEIIKKHVTEVEKIAKTDPKSAERAMELRNEYKVSELPIREGTEA